MEGFVAAEEMGRFTPSASKWAGGRKCRRQEMIDNSGKARGRSSRRDVLTGAVAGVASLATCRFTPSVLAQAREPIKLGVLNSFTGPAAYAADHSLKAMTMYFDSVGWTIAGRKVELVKEDDQFNAQVGLQKAKKLVESDRVDMIVGIQASNVAMAVINYVKQTKSYLVVTGAGTNAISWERYQYLFRTSLSSFQLSDPMANWAYANLAKEMVTSAADYAAGRDVLAQFRTPFEKGGGKILTEIFPPLGTTDFSPYLTNIKALRPPATYNFYPGTDALRFMQQYDEIGLKDISPFTGYALIDSVTLPALGRAALGVICATIYTSNLDNPENRQFVAAYKDKFKESPDFYSEYGFVAARVVDETLKATDGDTANKDKVAEAMTKVFFAAPRGNFRFDPVTHNPIQNVYITKVAEQEGHLEETIIGTLKNVQDPGKKD
jgi:branched-chain amino acid transport system substrate-binding protein